MGAGNQIIRNRDGQNVNTFYFDPYGSFEEEKKSYVEFEREELAGELTGLSFALVLICRVVRSLQEDVALLRVTAAVPEIERHS